MPFKKRAEWQVSEVELGEGQGMGNVTVRSTIDGRSRNKKERASRLGSF